MERRKTRPVFNNVQARYLKNRVRKTHITHLARGLRSATPPERLADAGRDVRRQVFRNAWKVARGFAVVVNKLGRVIKR